MTNPAFLSYKSPINLDFAKPTAMVITGVGNRYDGNFQEVRAKGAEVYAYLHIFEVPDNITHPVHAEFFGVGNAKDHLWGNNRSNWEGTTLLDIRKGSVWADWVVEYYSQLLAKDLFDGVFFDGVGARLWSSLAGWTGWPAEERAQWTTGIADLARRLDETRRAINPFSKIVHNNIWDLPKTDPSYAIAKAAEAYCDGVCLEHSNPLSLFHTNYAGRSFGDLGQRRLMVIARTDAEAKAWASVPGVTHVSNQPTSAYGTATVPSVGYSDLRIPEYKARISYLTGRVASLETEVDEVTAEAQQANARGDLEIARRIQAENLAIELDSKLDQIRSIVSG